MRATILPLAALLATSLSAPLKSHTDLSSTESRPSWKVTNYVTGCSPGGCTYNFDITSPDSSSSSPFHEPAFATSCAGTDVQSDLIPCSDPAVSTNEVPGVGNVTLIVQHTWQETLSDGSVGTFWIVGNHTIVDPVLAGGACFEVPQLEAYAIA